MSMDVSSQLNHWIALTGELEDTRELIAKAVYKHYRGGRIVDEYTLDLCRRLDDLFKQAKEYESFLQDDFKGYLQTGKDDKGLTLADKTKHKAMGLFTKHYINWQVSVYRKSFRETYVDVGMRAIGMVENGQEIIADPKIVQLCRYASKLKLDTDRRWEEIMILQKNQARGNLFVSLFQNFMVQLTAFSRSQSIPFIGRLTKGDEPLQRKIREQYRKARLTIQSGTS